MSGEEPSRRRGGIGFGDSIVGVEIDLQAEHELVRVGGEERVVFGCGGVVFAVE